MSVVHAILQEHDAPVVANIEIYTFDSLYVALLQLATNVQDVTSVATDMAYDAASS